MPNQREIAAELGITQATVSMALRGSPLVSEEMRRVVCEKAKAMGYRQNAQINAVMCRIRAGKKMSDKGVIALLIEARSLKEWYRIESYRLFHQGVVKRGLELGYRVESFFLQQPGMSYAKIDRILQSRGITGIIFAPPYHGSRELNLSWKNYTAVGVGFGWEAQELNRVVYDSSGHYITAFHALRRLGYRRIGTILGHELVYGHRHGTKWFSGYLECKNDFPENLEIPVFTGSFTHSGSTLTTEEIDVMGRECLEWFYQWRPDALLVIYAQHIMKWFHDAGLEFPRDVGLACLVQPPSSSIAGIGEKSDVVGATALEMVASQIAHNERGLPTHPKTTMIEGCWMGGATVRDRN